MSSPRAQTDAPMQLCLSAPISVALCSVIGIVFVALLYVGVVGIPDRDDPRVIKDRFLRVGGASALGMLIVASATTPRLQRADECPLPAPFLQWLGLWSPSLEIVPAALAVAVPLGVTMLLFLGPLVQTWIESTSGLSAPLLRGIQTHPPGARLQQVRNLLVGPLAEEWTFRACMCPLLHSAGFGEGTIVLIASLIFGAAHIHHRLDARVPWMAVAVQFTYTSLFGAYSTYLFLRTGLIYGPLLAHSFCNFMGLPNFAGVPSHRRARVLTCAYLTGLLGFTTIVSLDAVVRARIFHSMYWGERGREQRGLEQPGDE
jgi:prenyl protein peptidase